MLHGHDLIIRICSALHVILSKLLFACGECAFIVMYVAAQESHNVQFLSSRTPALCARAAQTLAQFSRQARHVQCSVATAFRWAETTRLRYVVVLITRLGSCQSVHVSIPPLAHCLLTTLTAAVRRYYQLAQLAILLSIRQVT